MPRLPRLFAEGVASHAILRGNNRQDIFRSNSDRNYFLRCLGEAAAIQKMAIHAYVLMSNHVHLLGTGSLASSIPKTIQSVGRRYVAYFNARYGRTGTLWEGRYRCTVVETDKYLLACHRYLDLNPVRAGLTPAPGDYIWSSHRFYVSNHYDSLVTPHETVIALGETVERRRLAYQSLFDEPMDDELLRRIRDCTNKAWALGDSDFPRLLEGQGVRRAIPLERGWRKGRRRIKESDPFIAPGRGPPAARRRGGRAAGR